VGKSSRSSPKKDCEIRFVRVVNALENQTLKELVDILESETRFYEDILKLSSGKTKILVDGKVSELEKIVKLEQTLVVQVARLENKREELTEKLASELGMELKDITMTEILKHLKSGEADRFAKCCKRLSGVIKELKSANDLNSKLIKNSLDFINFSINLLAGAGALNNSYTNMGLKPNPVKRSFFDKKL